MMSKIHEADEGEVPEFSSPACSMHEASDQYMGYADSNEVTTFLNELLEAERAGARVTLESARAAGNGPLAELLRTIQRDEARWCGEMLPRVRDGRLHVHLSAMLRSHECFSRCGHVQCTNSGARQETQRPGLDVVDA